MTDRESAAPYLALDLAVSAILLGLLVGALLTGFMQGPPTVGPATVFAAIYVQTWGLLFFCSYFVPDGTYLLKGLMWLCLHAAVPRGRWTALLWGSIAVFVGSTLLLEGLGWLPE